MKRTFIAFDIVPAASTKAAYDEIRLKLKQEKITWVDDARFHLTLKFLGDTKEEQIPEISETLEKAISGFKSFPVTLAGMGIFKNVHDPRVLWLGCRFDDRIEQIKKAIDDALVPFGFEAEGRSFSPHFTLGRIKQIRQVNPLTELIAAYSGVEFQQQQIRQIIFYESHLKPTGALYTPISVFSLG
jgi:2'-5' RNA ligase